MNYLQCLNPTKFWFYTITLYNKFTNHQSNLSIDSFFGNDFNQHRMGANNSNVVSYSYEFSDNLNRLYRNHSSDLEQSSYSTPQLSISTMQQMNDSRIGVRAVRKKRGFATFRRKFIRKRKTSKIHDHVRVIRECVSTWNPIEIKMLLDEYESLAALKDLTIQADLARSPATTFKQDLSNLFDTQFCSDVEIIYRGISFPVHRAILSVRCPYFRDLLAEYPNYGARIRLELETTSVDVNLFSIILKYLYTGDLTQSQTGQDLDFSILRRLNDEFNTPNSLENDLEYLLDYGNFADAVLVFTSENIQSSLKSDSSNSEYGFRSKLELRCHKAILSARSQFFHKIISRRSRQSAADDDHDGCPQCDGGANSIIYHYCNNHNSTKIVLDETVIPKRFARVLLHAIYLDTVDLSLIYQSNEFHENKTHYTTVLNTHTINDDNNMSNNRNHSSNIHSNLNTNQYRPSLLDEAMELYQIGRFLELDILSQGCEDLIVDWISIDTIVTILQWSAQPYGSDWVHRQALHFLREEFEIIYQSPVLYQLRKIDLFEILDSDFVQASEFEILQSIIKWSESELLRQMEEREPNSLSNTSHSVNKKPKKRDLNDMELNRILTGLLQLVRTEHIIPHNIDYVTQIIKRGLIGTPFNYRIGIEGNNYNDNNNDNNEHDRINTINPWIRKKNQSHIYLKRPRLFTPYHDTLKIIYANQQHNLESATDSFELNQLFYNDVPDALYMVDNGFEFDCGSLLDSDELRNHRPNQSHYRRLNFYQNKRNNLFYKYDSNDEEKDNDEDDNKNTHDYQLLSIENKQNDLGKHYLNDQCLNMLSIPDENTLNTMLKRLHKLYNTTSCQRALSLRLSLKHEVKLQIKLRVVREFNLPDQIAFILDKHYKKFLNNDSNKLSSNNSKVQTIKNTISEAIDYFKDPLLLNKSKDTYSKHIISNDNIHLSDLMPDVTIATASVNQLQIRDQSDISLNLNNLNTTENSSLSTSSMSVNNTNRFCTSHRNRSISPKYSTFRLNSNSKNNQQFF